MVMFSRLAIRANASGTMENSCHPGAPGSHHGQEIVPTSWWATSGVSHFVAANSCSACRSWARAVAAGAGVSVYRGALAVGITFSTLRKTSGRRCRWGCFSSLPTSCCRVHFLSAGCQLGAGHGEACVTHFLRIVRGILLKGMHRGMRADLWRSPYSRGDLTIGIKRYRQS